jgi:folylpolyglutamate synthase/dihydropteroate synthase
VLVIGMRSNHGPEPFLRILAPLAARVVATTPPFRPQPAAEIAAAADRIGLPVEEFGPAPAAIESALASARNDEVVVVTGSFYTVGETPRPLRGLWAAED